MGIFDELTEISFWRDVVCEFICTFFLLLYITFSKVTLSTASYQPSTASTGVMAAFIVAVLIECFGNVSGCFMNPAITFGVFLKMRMSFVRWFLFTGVQLLGGYAGASTVWGITPSNLTSMIEPMQPSSLIGNGQAVAVEFLMTFILVYIVLSTTDESLGRPKVTYFSIPVGMAVGAAVIATGTFTGASMNPAINFAVSAVNCEFPRQWIYWVAQYPAGAVAACLHYIFVYTKPKPMTEKIEANDVHSEIQDKTKTRTDDIEKKEDLGAGDTNLAFTCDNTIL